MKQKLNLTIEQELVEFARRIGLERHLSISQMFEQWIKSLKEEGTGSFIERFHKKNRFLLDRLSDEDVENLKVERVRKWM